MHLLDFCHICGKKHTQTEFFHIMVHHFNNYVVCDDRGCHRLHSEKIMRDELINNVFIAYSFTGITTSIKIPRTDGSFSTGNIVDRQTLDDYLFITDNNPQLRVEFNDYVENYMQDATYIERIYGDADHLKMQYTKYLAYDTLARHNLHLPMVHISQRCFTNTELNAKFVKNQQSLYNFCAHTNKATKMIMMARHRNTTYFSCLPEELVRLIIYFYFN